MTGATVERSCVKVNSRLWEPAWNGRCLDVDLAGVSGIDPVWQKNSGRGQEKRHFISGLSLDGK
jgi:hypothetical protein